MAWRALRAWIRFLRSDLYLARFPRGAAQPDRGWHRHAGVRKVASRHQRDHRRVDIAVRRAHHGGAVTAPRRRCHVGRFGVVLQLFFPAAGWNLDHCRCPELGGSVRVPGREPCRQPAVARGTRTNGRSDRPARRAGAAVRFESRRPRHERKLGPRRAPGASDRPAIRPGLRGNRAARIGRLVGLRGGRQPGAARRSPIDRGVRSGCQVARVRRIRSHLRGSSNNRRRGPQRPTRALARRHDACRRARGIGTAGRGRDSRYTGGRRRDRHRADAVPQGAEGRGTDAAERRAQDRAPRLAGA